MTIILHWWYLTILLVIAGPFLASFDKSTGYMGGFGGGLVCIACWIVAIAYTLGALMS